MANKRQNSLDKNVWTGIVIFLTVIVVFLLVLVFNATINPTGEQSLKNEGYKTEDDEDPFYKKIVTNNTLDDFYNDMASNKSSTYEEYYLAKESYNFIELKMTYNEGASTTLNITSDLKTQEVEFNYELSYKSAHLIINGNSKDTYSCQIIVQKGVNSDTVKSHCDYIMKEITTFLDRREDILQNDKIREMINYPMKEYVEEE